jgi:hypothetical protein
LFTVLLVKFKIRQSHCLGPLVRMVLVMAEVCSRGRSHVSRHETERQCAGTPRSPSWPHPSDLKTSHKVPPLKGPQHLQIQSPWDQAFTYGPLGDIQIVCKLEQ